MNFKQFEKMNKKYEELEKSNPIKVKKLKKLINKQTSGYMTRYMFEDKFLVFSLSKLVIDIFKLFDNPMYLYDGDKKTIKRL